MERAQEALVSSRYAEASATTAAVFRAGYCDGWTGFALIIKAEERDRSVMNAAYIDAHELGVRARAADDKARASEMIVIERVP